MNTHGLAAVADVPGMLTELLPGDNKEQLAQSAWPMVCLHHRAARIGQFDHARRLQ